MNASAAQLSVVAETPAQLPRMGEVVTAKREETDQSFWSVTTLLKTIDKSDALIGWACNEQAERTVDSLAQIKNRLQHEGREQAIDLVSGMRWRTDGLLYDAQLGTIAHHLFNLYALDGTRPKVTPDLHPDYPSKRKTLDRVDMVTLGQMLDQFDRFLQEWQPDYWATEVVVYNPTYEYAGQCDGFVRFDGRPTIIDYKTSRKTWTKRNELRGPYPEVGLQLAAYRYAERAAVHRARRYSYYSRRYYLLSDSEKDAAMELPEVEGGVAIYVTPERYGVYPVRCERATDPDDPTDVQEFEVFLHLIEVARWHLLRAKQMVGNPMEPPHPISPTDDPFAGLPTD